MSRQGWLIAAGVFVAMLVDGVDLQSLSLALPSISKDMHLDPVQAGALSSYTFLGMAIGGVLAGWLADRIGRVRVTRYSVTTFTLCTGLIALCNNYFEVALLRFVSGFGIAALSGVGPMVVAEYVPTRIRTTVLSSLQAGWSLGYVVAALASSYFQPRYGWRPLFWFAIPPGVLALALLWRLPDPPSWKRSATPELARLSALIRDPLLRRTCVLWGLASIGLQFGYYGANSWLPSYVVKDLGVNLQSMGWYVAASYMMGFFGKILIGLLADRLGRRPLWLTAGLATAMYMPVLVIFATPQNAPWLLLLFGLLYPSPYAVNYTYLAESFPSTIRGTAIALSYNVGRIGATSSPVLIGMIASKYSIGMGIAMLGIAYAVCALVPGIFIREKMYDPNAVESKL